MAARYEEEGKIMEDEEEHKALILSKDGC